MIYSEFDNIKIEAVAAAVSKDECFIEELMKTMGSHAVEQFEKKTGIRSIRLVTEQQTASDYSFLAAKTIENAGMYNPSEIGVLVNVTQQPDYRSPSTACVLQKRLGLDNSCMAFDVNLGCSGFVYGVSLASSVLQTSDAQKALVLVGDTLARGRVPGHNDKDVSNTGYLFGDASAAVLIGKEKGNTIRSALMTDGSGFKALACPYGGWKHPIGPETYPGDDVAVFSFAIREVPDLINQFLEKTDTTIENYDSIVLHQANMMIIKQIAKRLKVPMEKVPISLDRYGNTSGASVPLTIVDHYGEKTGGTLKILASGFGVGLSWGVLSFEIATDSILPIRIGSESFDDGYQD